MKTIFTAIIALLLNIGIYAQSITVTSPNGGEVWAGCTSHNITWTSSGVSNYYNIDYSTDNGATWVSLTSSLYVNNGTYSWVVPNVSSTSCRVKVTDANTPTTFDISNATFSITAPLIVTSPNGGESWEGGTIKTISWAATGTTSYFDLFYSTDAGATWTSIVSNYYTASGQYAWTLPNSPSTTCLIKVRDHTNTTCMVDQSNNLFTITPATPVITVTNPNNTQTRYTGNTTSITWTSSWVTSNALKIDYSTDNGTSWIPIITNTQNTGSYSWIVPNTPSTQCLVKITDLGNPATYDISNTTFTIAPPYITVTAPNGGENYVGCSSQSITWTTAGTSGTYAVKYSTDNGLSWTTLSNSASGSTYTWSQVPNLNSSTCLVKVSDYNSPGTRDSSNANFNILKNTDIIITSPNGGESWEAGTSKTISWVAAPSSTRWSVYYSTNNGSNWTVINSSVYSTSLTWTVPNLPSATCLIKVVDYDNTCKIDISNALFTIAPPTPVITVTNPNTATTLYCGNTASIAWTSQYLTSTFVRIEYTTNNGANWSDVAAVTENDGTYSWTVPTAISSQCRIRISEYNNAVVFDESNTNFTIAQPFITVTAPNGGENWLGCSTQTISWTAGGTSGSYKMYYSSNSGASWTLIGSSSSTSYSWNPVVSLASSSCLIKVTDNSNANIKDSSNAVFTITPNTDIVVTSPNGGESWEAGTSKTISWVAAPASTHWSVYYSTNNGSSWTVINSSTYSTSLTWTVPNLPSATCLIKVADYDNPCKYDVSNAVFTITPPTPVITVTSPNTAVTWYVGNSANITWTSQYLTSAYVIIDYTVNNGANWLNITTITENDGTYSWTVPNMSSANCRVRISEYNNAVVFDESNTNFTIAPPYITITAPNGGQNWEGCSSQTISWTAGGCSGSYRMYYSLSGGGSWTSIGTTSSTSYTWNPINNITSASYRIKVTDNANQAIKDSSDAVFTIYQNADIVITSPNGGESWEVGTSKTITWVSEPTTTRYAVYYSTNGGSSWNTIVSSTYSTSATWTVPNAPSANCLIKVEDVDKYCINDVSDAVFTIAPPTPVITVTQPNTATTLYSGNSATITWTSQYLTSAFVRIEYTTNNGSSWADIATVTENDGTYSWTIPNTPSANCRVRISEYNNAVVFDESNTNFTIAPPFITVSAPNGGQNWEGCSSQTISWTAGGCSGTYRMYYSLLGGGTWTSIGTSSSTSYTWNPINNITSSSYRIKVTDNANPAIKDSSDAVFTIYQNADIVITSPNGGESWEVGTTRTITWVSEPTSTRYAVYYSTNGGSSWNTIVSSTYITSATWTVPNAPSANCLIKVEDYDKYCINDVSNAAFTISPPTPVITVTQPNTAATLYSGNNATINWTSQYLTSSFVRIEFTTDNGTSWTDVASVTENDGSYSWTVPNVQSANCRIRISEYNNAVVNDQSNVNFSIAKPFITITSPNGGETWEGCTQQYIYFNSGGTSGAYIMKYSTDNGFTWNSAGSTSGSPFTWNPVVNTPSTQCLVKIYSNSNPAIADSSDAPFTIASNDDIILTSPNGGEQWQAGSTQLISWVSDPSITTFAVYYSVNNGSTWTTITSYTSAHSYSWTVPNNPGTGVRIKVEDYNSNCRKDISDAAFTITPGTPALTSPNGRQTWYYASTYNITWTNQYFYGTYVTLSYSVDSGASWLPITTATNNNGSYAWTIPNTASSQCLVKVNEYNNPAVFDVSNATFTIAPALVIGTPNGNNGMEEWRVCTQTTIQWTSGGCSGNYKIEYSTDNGSSWTTIVSSYYSAGTNNSYNWTIPNTPSTNCLVRVSDVSASVKTDISDAAFTIKPSIIVTAPNGGQSLPQASSFNITWTSDGASNYYNIDYSTDGGSTWTNIIYNQYITGGSYTWTVPSVTSSNCKIRVTDYINTCKTDMSDNTFSIGMPVPTITVTSPNGGNVLSGCSTSNISWNATNTSNNYTIEYSSNNGSTWNTIISNLNTMSGTYSWAVPNIASTNCLVRIKDYSNPSIMDVSNATFTINQSVTAAITAGGPVSLCEGNSVVLTSSSATGNLWYPGGQTTQSITVSNSGPYYVVVTNAGCPATSNTINVTVSAIPSAPVASSNSPVPLNGILQLTSSTIPGASYTWSGPNSFSAIVQNPAISNATNALNGTYSVFATIDGCSGPSGSTVVNVNSSPSTVTISGSVIGEQGSFVGGVKLKRTGATADSMVTSTDGQYHFDVTQGTANIVTPSKNNDVINYNGISSFDIVLMQRHIGFNQLLSSPYKIIAADVNSSGTVNSVDVAITKALILQNITSFPGNKLWSFINSSFVFADPLHPFPYESSRQYSSVNAASDQNFIGVKLGDLNNSWDPNVAKVLSQETLSMKTENAEVLPGDIITVPVTVQDFHDISGFQYTLSWDNSVLEFIEANNVSLSMDFGNTQTSGGKLTALWTTEDPEGVDLENSSIIFVLKFRVIGHAGESSAVSINSGITSLEAVNSDLEMVTINAEAGIIKVMDATGIYENNFGDYQLFQNEPNPFTGNTKISFSIPARDEVIITIHDIFGKEVAIYKETYEPGVHSIIWNGTDLKGNRLGVGTYYYRMQSGKFTEVRNMILFK